MRKYQGELDWRNVQQILKRRQIQKPTRLVKLNKVMNEYLDFLKEDEEMAELFTMWALGIEESSANPKARIIVDTDRKLSPNQKETVLENVADFYWNKYCNELEQKRSRKHA